MVPIKPGSHVASTPWVPLVERVDLADARAVLVAAAAGLQVGSRPDGWCWNPGAHIQGHAVWHLLGAAPRRIAVWALASSKSALAQRQSAPHDVTTLTVAGVLFELRRR
jgi:hypothetical protein